MVVFYQACRRDHPANMFTKVPAGNREFDAFVTS